jgi:ABC-type polar amino acid transport system ATPase subunit
MLIVTHQVGFAREFADRVCCFYAGRSDRCGSVENILVVEIQRNVPGARTSDVLAEVPKSFVHSLG